MAAPVVDPNMGHMAGPGVLRVGLGLDIRATQLPIAASLELEHHHRKAVQEEVGKMEEVTGTSSTIINTAPRHPHHRMTNHRGVRPLILLPKRKRRKRLRAPLTF